VRTLAALLRVADALDRTHGRLVRAVRCQVRRKTIELRIEVEGDPELELWATRRKGDLLESLFGLQLRLAVDAVARVRASTVAERGPAGTGAGARKRAVTPATRKVPPLRAPAGGAARVAKKTSSGRSLSLVG